MVGGGGVHQFYISSDTTTKLIECLCNPDGREQKTICRYSHNFPIF